MPYAGMWSPVSPGEQISYSISFAPRMARGDTISTATPTVAISVADGSDGAASSLLIGVPIVDTSRLIVSQMVGPGFVEGVTYRLTMTVTTEAGETLKAWGHLRCDAIA